MSSFVAKTLVFFFINQRILVSNLPTSQMSRTHTDSHDFIHMKQTTPSFSIQDTFGFMYHCSIDLKFCKETTNRKQYSILACKQSWIYRIKTNFQTLLLLRLYYKSKFYRRFQRFKDKVTKRYRRPDQQNSLYLVHII